MKLKNYRYHLSLIKFHHVKNFLKGNLTPLRERIFPNHWKFKWDLKYAIESQGLKLSDVGISRVLVIPTFRKIHFFIRLKRPGIFIGRQGRTFYAIEKQLSYLGKPVCLHLRDFDPFRD